MLKRWSAENLDRELARRNPVPDSHVGGAAHTSAATALLRHILELADGTSPAGAASHDDAGVAISAATDAAAPGATGAGTGAATGEERAGRGGDRARRLRQLPLTVGTAHPLRVVATGLAVLAVVAGGISAIVSVTGSRIPHRTTTTWLASRPLTVHASSATAGADVRASSSWKLVGDIVPAGWKLGTPGPGPGMVTCPTTAVCYVTGDTSTSPSGPSVLGGLYVSTNGASSWSVLALPKGFTFTSELTCVTALACAAGGMEDGTPVLAETRDGGHRWTVTTTGDAGGLVHLTCMSTSECTALSLPPSVIQAIADGTSTPRPFDELFVRTTDGGERWRTTVLPATVHFSALQCTTDATCVTIGYPAGTSGGSPHGVALWTDDAGLRWEHGSLPAGVGFSGISALACRKPAYCMAVGTVAIPNPSRCTTALQASNPATVTPPTAFSCTSEVTAWVSTMLTTEDGGATWQEKPLPSSVPQPHLDDVACPGPMTCWAGGTEAAPRGKTLGSSVLLGTADGGATWTAATVAVPQGAPNDQGGDAYLAVGSISCPSAAVCVALGVVDQGTKFAPVYRMDVAP